MSQSAKYRREYPHRGHPPKGYRWRVVADQEVAYEGPLQYAYALKWSARHGHLAYQICDGAPWLPCANGNGIPVIPTRNRIRLWSSLLNRPFEKDSP